MTNNNTILQKDVIEWIQNHAMTSGQLMDMLNKDAQKYVIDSQQSLIRNYHMNDLNRVSVDQKIIDAVIVDFLNYVAWCRCMDYGMYTLDLQKNKRLKDIVV